LAAEIGDRASLAHALIGQGRLYEREHRWPEALALTRRGVFSAQGVRSPDLLFRGEWQAGRLLRELKDYPGAIAAMERARAELEVIRHDLALHYGHPNSGTSFREVTGGLFFDLADLLLRQADDATPESVPQLLTQARDAAEALKAAELEDYFQDECVNLLRQKTAKLESVATDAAILYIIPLPDRTETIITIGNKVQRVKSAATSREVEETATRMRRLLENRSTNEYLAPARQLYQWLITPLQKTLTEAGVTTLVFVPGGALRTIPMSALNDGSHFLIEQYAVAVAPGLTLLEPVPINRAPGAIILSGLSEARQNFPALPYVPAELSHLHDLYGGDELIDRDFVQRNVEQKFDAQPYQIVHIASHGHFDHDAAKTFLLTFDGKLTLNDLERLLQPARLRDQPVELLTLSACQTAAGDERAALGLAGVAVKAGARSALATLWFVNDEASASVVTDFYTQLHRSPKLNKAQALQTAQRHLLADPRYEHPCYWAPYLLIGNWL
jgi:CHAT domain-containing protein